MPRSTLTRRAVFPAMGTVVSVDWAAPQGASSQGATSMLRTLEQVFADLEKDFSLYRPDSELSRIASGTVKLEDASESIRLGYARALEWRSATRGAFTPHRPDGVIDLNGIVKAVAIEQAGLALDAAGALNWCVNAGGDILCSAQSSGRTLGIVDPGHRAQLLCSVTLDGQRRALATSGSTERGDHIWSSTVSQGSRFIQVTVAANDIVTADVLATAVVSGGKEALDWATEHWDVDVLTVDAAGDLLATPGIASALGNRQEAASG